MSLHGFISKIGGGSTFIALSQIVGSNWDEQVLHSNIPLLLGGHPEIGLSRPIKSWSELSKLTCGTVLLTHVETYVGFRDPDFYRLIERASNVEEYPHLHVVWSATETGMVPALVASQTPV